MAERGIYANDVPDMYDVDMDMDSTEFVCQTSSAFIPLALPNITSEKLVRGQLDNTYSKYPNTGQTVPGGVADYMLTVRNDGNVKMEDLIVIDILPWVGDNGVLDPQARLTAWRPNLAGPVIPPVGVKVYYSLENNPCRPELNYSPSGCTSANWSLSPPLDITSVQSLKFDFDTLILNPGDSLSLTWPMRAPVDAPTAGEIAWNSFGYIAARMDNGAQLLAAEPVKVGIAVEPLQPAVYGNYIWLDTNENGLQDESGTSISGVIVQLYEDNGDGISDPNTDNLVNFTVSDANGNYVFPNLPVGDYFAVFSLPVGYTASPSNLGSDDALDSDGLITPVTSLTLGEIDLTWDLGIFPNTACDLKIKYTTVSPCAWNGAQSQTTVNVFVEWANAPAGENIEISIAGQTQTIDILSGATSPTLMPFVLTADGSSPLVTSNFISNTACSDMKTVQLPNACQPNPCATPLQMTLTAANTTICPNENETLTPTIDLTSSSCTSGFSYLWSTGATSDTLGIYSSGDYAVTVTDCNGCIAADTITITEGTFSAFTFDEACHDNKTQWTAADDYFISIFTAFNSLAGASNRFLAYHNGTLLNSGGTVYGLSASVGSDKRFTADGATGYFLTIVDFDNPDCQTILQIGPVDPCSDCPTATCLPVQLFKN